MCRGQNIRLVLFLEHCCSAARCKMVTDGQVWTHSDRRMTFWKKIENSNSLIHFVLYNRHVTWSCVWEYKIYFFKLYLCSIQNRVARKTLSDCGFLLCDSWGITSALGRVIWTKHPITDFCLQYIYIFVYSIWYSLTCWAEHRPQYTISTNMQMSSIDTSLIALWSCGNWPATRCQMETLFFHRMWTQNTGGKLSMQDHTSFFFRETSRAQIAQTEAKQLIKAETEAGNGGFHCQSDFIVLLQML